MAWRRRGVRIPLAPLDPSVREPAPESCRCGTISSRHSEHELLEGALSFPERSVRTVLIPTSRLEVLDSGISAADVKAKAPQNGFSRFPVRDSEGELMGYLHLKTSWRRTLPSGSVRSPPSASPSHAHAGRRRSLCSALRLMQERGTHLARVHEPDGRFIGGSNARGRAGGAGWGNPGRYSVGIGHSRKRRVLPEY